MVPDVALVRCETYEEAEVSRALGEAIAAIGGLDWVKPGMKVALKANLVISRKPEGAATTHPAVLCALTKELTARGAEVIVGDSPGGVYNSAYVNRVYRGAGLTAVEAAGAKLNQNFAEADRDLPDAKTAKFIRYTAWLDDADAVIDVCKLKSHGMMGMSAAAKNMFGVIPGTVKPEYHVRFPEAMDFARMIVDLDCAFPIRLCVCDAVVGMEGNGPTAGKPRQIGALLASFSPHAMDAVCAQIIGLPAEQIPTLAAAKERGLLPETVTTSQPVEPFCIPDFDNIKNAAHLAEQNGAAALWGKAADRFLKKVLASKPGVEKSECVGCRECEKVCPRKAITMKNHKPHIDRSLCIRCFCCQEFCPKGAMKVRRSPIARIAGKL